MTVSFSEKNRRSRLMFALSMILLVLAVVQIVRTYDVFSHTWDEPIHISPGIELLDKGTYDLNPHHPPLARLVVALGPYLDGIRSTAGSDVWAEGWRILYDAGDYERTLTLARLGVLPFLVLLSLLAWFWTRRLWGASAATLGSLLLLTQPAILAHAGLATTDLPMVTMCVWSLFSFVLWLERPSVLRTVSLGIGTGLALMTKFSAIPFLAVGFLAVTGYRWILESPSWNPGRLLRNPALGSSLAALALVFLSAWAVFGFGWSETSETTLADLTPNCVPKSLPMVITTTWEGIESVAEQNRFGHRTYLLGERSGHGWWYYFPVAILVKTTIPLLLLAATGLAVALRSGWLRKDWKLAAPGLMALSILAFVTTVNINLGLRHVLVVYPLLAIQGAIGAYWLLTLHNHVWIGRLGATVLLLWQGTIVFSAFPDYLAWFNAFAGPSPERVLITSDLDWGQDLKRLSTELEAREIRFVAIAYNGRARMDRHGLPSNIELEPGKPVTGWVAASLWSREWYDGLHWLKDLRPETRVGKSIDLYFIEPADLPANVRAQARMREAMGIRYTLRDVEWADRLFLDVLAMNPTHYGALWQHAYALETLGRLEEAELAWQAVLAAARRTGFMRGETDALARLHALKQRQQSGQQVQ